MFTFVSIPKPGKKNYNKTKFDKSKIYVLFKLKINFNNNNVNFHIL